MFYQMMRIINITLIITLFIGCAPKLRFPAKYDIKGELKSPFKDSTYFTVEPKTLFEQHSKPRIAITIRKGFIYIMNLEEFDSIIDIIETTFRKNEFEIVDRKEFRSAYLKNNYKIDEDLMNDFNLDFVFVLNTFIDNGNYKIDTYYTANQKEGQRMPCIFYPYEDLCSDQELLEKWSKDKDIIIIPLGWDYLKEPGIECIYGITETLIYSAELNNYVGYLKIYLSDFDFNDRINFSYKRNHYNTSSSQLTAEGIKTSYERYTIEIKPNGLYGDFNFAELYVNKIITILK